MVESTRRGTCSLVPINLNNADEVEELRQHRIACGWDYSLDAIALWKEKQDLGVKSFFWITISQPSPEHPTSPGTIRVGHISLDAYCNPPDPDLASADKSNLTIQTFFILPAYRSGGLGGRAMDLVESMTTEEPYGSPACKYITLNTLTKRYYYEDTPVGRHLQGRPSVFNGHEWYERRGYVAWKEEERYPDTLPDGTPVNLVAVFMRKKVGGPETVS